MGYGGGEGGEMVTGLRPLGYDGVEAMASGLSEGSEWGNGQWAMAGIREWGLGQ